MAHSPTSPVCELCEGAGATLAVRRVSYLQLLSWAFALFNTLRVFAYLPTLAGACALIGWYRW